MKAGIGEFKMADSWPGLLTGTSIVSGTEGMNLPVAGFIDAASSDPDVELVPLLWCAAEPSAHVEDDAFERIAAMIIDGLRGAGKLDGIYLDLHGAMVTETYGDGEGEMLHRIRAAVGSEIPIAVSLDLHANITNAMVEHASTLTIYRTYPHLDMAESGARSFAQLRSLIGGVRYEKVFRQVPFLIPLSAQHTGSEPCRSLYAELEQLAPPSACLADIALGFTAADIADCGPSIVAYAPQRETAEAVAEQLLASMLAAEEHFDCRLLSPAEAVKSAIAMNSRRPVIIADVQDNPGAGATSDTTGLLFALVEQKAQGALVGLMHDPVVAAKAHAAGIGADVHAALGGKSGVEGEKPYSGRFRVEALSDGHCTFTGEMYGGGTAVLGPCAVLKVEDVEADIRIVVSSNRSQCLDLTLFTHIGVDPRSASIVVVKSTVHFRADFEPIAEAIISSAAPGVFPCELDRAPYRNLRNGMRLGPKGRIFVSNPD